MIHYSRVADLVFTIIYSIIAIVKWPSADSASSAVRNLYAHGLLLVLLFFGSSGWGQQPVSLEVPVKGSFDFIAYGNVRFTKPGDSAPSNPEYRRALVNQIASIKPTFVLFSGDLVLRGDNPADWAVYENETKPWAEAKLRFFPTIGNHELARDEASGLRNYSHHFPELKDSRYYSVRAGNTLTLVLDSSQDEASGTQGQWLASQLDHLPGNTDFVFFLLHHPPYTRSREGFLGVGGHTARAREQALAKMLEERQSKTRPRFVVFSGHVHNYERYEHQGVTYIVTGGGGATPYPIMREPQDAYREPGHTYHYCLVQVNGAKLQLDMMKLEMQNGRPSFTRADSVVISAPAAKAASAK